MVGILSRSSRAVVEAEIFWTSLASEEVLPSVDSTLRCTLGEGRFCLLCCDTTRWCSTVFEAWVALLVAVLPALARADAIMAAADAGRFLVGRFCTGLIEAGAGFSCVRSTTTGATDDGFAEAEDAAAGGGGFRDAAKRRCRSRISRSLADNLPLLFDMLEKSQDGGDGDRSNGTNVSPSGMCPIMVTLTDFCAVARGLSTGSDVLKIARILCAHAPHFLLRPWRRPTLPEQQ